MRPETIDTHQHEVVEVEKQNALMLTEASNFIWHKAFEALTVDVFIRRGCGKYIDRPQVQPNDYLQTPAQGVTN